MGNYTELNCAFRLVGGAHDSVVEALKFMMGVNEKEPIGLPRHALFSAMRWRSMLVCDSYYFDGDTSSTIRFDKIANCYCVTIRCNFKNYDDEIKKFLDWITPFIDIEDGNFVGYARYEQDQVPTLIYHPNTFFRPDVPESVAHE